jgi:hypothetical protein
MRRTHAPFATMLVLGNVFWKYRGPTAGGHVRADPNVGSGGDDGAHLLEQVCGEEVHHRPVPAFIRDGSTSTSSSLRNNARQLKTP